MREWLCIVVWSFASVLRSRRDLAIENIAPRQQLMVLRRQPGSVCLRDRDRLFWVWLRCVWKGWREALVLVQPDTVVRWHRKGFRTYWRWKSRAKGGRPRIDPSVRSLIRHMWSWNPTWGAPRVRAESHKLGIDVSDATVWRYRPLRVSPCRWRKPHPSGVGRLCKGRWMTQARHGEVPQRRQSRRECGAGAWRSVFILVHMTTGI